MPEPRAGAGLGRALSQHDVRGGRAASANRRPIRLGSGGFEPHPDAGLRADPACTRGSEQGERPGCVTPLLQRLSRSQEL